MIRKTVSLYVLLVAIARFGGWITIGTYTMYLQSHGLGLLQINMVNMMFYVTMLVCEVPTGAIADIFGRRKTFLLACLLKAAGPLVYGFSNSLPGFLLAESIFAIGMTLENGAFQSWLVDSLTHFGHDGMNRSVIFAKAEKWGMITSAIAAIAGTKLAAINPVYPWLVAAVSMLVCAAIAYFVMKEEYWEKKVGNLRENVKSIGKVTVTGIKSAIGNKVVLFLFAIGLVHFCSIQAPNMQWPIYMNTFIKSKSNLGYVGMLILFSLGIGSHIVQYHLIRVKSRRTSIMITQIALGLGLITAVILRPFYLVLPAFLVHEVARGMFKPIKDEYLHESITDSSLRATSSSFESMARHIGGIIGLLSSGLIAQRLSIHSAWIASGVFLIVATVIISVVYRKNK